MEKINQIKGVSLQDMNYFRLLKAKRLHTGSVCRMTVLWTVMKFLDFFLSFLYIQIVHTGLITNYFLENFHNR
jgi:hypothetical protein